jgi:hypothetical protein
VTRDSAGPGGGARSGPEPADGWAAPGGGGMVDGGGLGDGDLGGDPACWLARVCPECGRLTEERDPTHCAACGEPLP